MVMNYIGTMLFVLENIHVCEIQIEKRPRE